MPAIRANNIEIFFDEFGDKSKPAVLLVMGLGTQMIAWPENFCEMIASRGFRVIRFDNRDVGLSAKFNDAPRVNMLSAFLKAMLRIKVNSPYSLDDMALDAIGLLDALGIEQAHIVGASLGGMIAQIIAAKHHTRTRSLISVMSTSGDPNLPLGKGGAMKNLFTKRPAKDDREAAIEFGMRILRSIGSPGYPLTDYELRERVERAYDRSYYPAGFARQFVAVLAGGSRVQLLKTIGVPTLVLHGEDDPLVNIAGGKDTARHIPGAVLKLIPGWGHDLPPALVPQLAGLVAAHCAAADRAA